MALDLGQPGHAARGSVYRPSRDSNRMRRLGLVLVSLCPGHGVFVGGRIGSLPTKTVLVMGAGLPIVLKLCFVTLLVNLIAEKKRFNMNKLPFCAISNAV